MISQIVVFQIGYRYCFNLDIYNIIDSWNNASWFHSRDNILFCLYKNIATNTCKFVFIQFIKLASSFHHILITEMENPVLFVSNTDTVYKIMPILIQAYRTTLHGLYQDATSINETKKIITANDCLNVLWKSSLINHHAKSKAIQTTNNHVI